MLTSKWANSLAPFNNYYFIDNAPLEKKDFHSFVGILKDFYPAILYLTGLIPLFYNLVNDVVSYFYAKKLT